MTVNINQIIYSDSGVDNFGGNLYHDRLAVSCKATADTIAFFEIDGNVGYDPIFLIYTHDNLEYPYLVATLVGGNNRAQPWSFKISPLYRSTYIKITGGDYKHPLVIESTIPNIDGKLTMMSVGGIDLSKCITVKAKERRA